MKQTAFSPETRMMGYGYKPELSEGAVKCPIFQTSTFVFRSAEEGKAFFEMAYGKPSTFLDQAKARGVPTSEGYGMLVGQAIESFSIWNSVKPNLKDFL